MAVVHKPFSKRAKFETHQILLQLESNLLYQGAFLSKLSQFSVLKNQKRTDRKSNESMVSMVLEGCKDL